MLAGRGIDGLGSRGIVGLAAAGGRAVRGGARGGGSGGGVGGLAGRRGMGCFGGIRSRRSRIGVGSGPCPTSSMTRRSGFWSGCGRSRGRRLDVSVGGDGAMRLRPFAMTEGLGAVGGSLGWGTDAVLDRGVWRRACSCRLPTRRVGGRVTAGGGICSIRSRGRILGEPWRRADGVGF